MIKTILVPTDGSDHANKAIELAADLAGKYSARIVILHALLRHNAASDLKAICENLGAPADLMQSLTDVEDAFIESAAVAYGPVPIMVPHEVLEQVGVVITEAATKLAKAKGAKDVTVTIADGAPADLILKAAKDQNADTIVMGSRGLGNLSGLLMGSVSHKVGNLAECTCITVK
ncbi:MAG: universal stress protein [Rhodospirillales bacterium]|nr:universal stress protein [Rhodospirillales bacterium]